MHPSGCMQYSERHREAAVSPKGAGDSVVIALLYQRLSQVKGFLVKLRKGGLHIVLDDLVPVDLL